MASDRDGFAGWVLAIRLEGGGHAVEDVLACLAVGDSLLQVLVDSPGAEHLGGPCADGRAGRAFMPADAGFGQFR